MSGFSDFTCCFRFSMHAALKQKTA